MAAPRAACTQLSATTAAPGDVNPGGLAPSGDQEGRPRGPFREDYDLSGLRCVFRAGERLDTATLAWA